ncbi:MAG: DUF3987 domain-containing protein [Solirubrobacteraceae bacterium]
MSAPQFAGRQRTDLTAITGEPDFYEDGRGGVYMADDAAPRTATDFSRFGRFPRDRQWPEPSAPEARHGLAGDFVDLVDPVSEADPVALLAQFLVGFGNVIGRGPGFIAEGDHHATNLNVAIVGQTSKARKGTSWGRVRQALALVDPEWVEDRVTSGLSSGEGLVWQVRDPIVTRRKGRKNDDADHDGDVEELVDAGVIDKRLLVVEGELAQGLRVMRREGNTLSVAIRNLWDSGNHGALIKNSPGRTTGALVSIIGHITKDELRRELTATDTANGFANRFLFICARRSKALPDGGEVPADDMMSIARLIAAAVEHARSVGVLVRDENARELWHHVYPRLSEGRPGMLGAITGRAEAQVMRLAVIYALLDGRKVVRVEHLRAALALWDYCERSAAYIFGEDVGDPVADEILAALQAAPEGLTHSEIRDLFKRHKTAARLNIALRALAEAGLATSHRRSTGGRPVEHWCAVSAQSAERSA